MPKANRKPPMRAKPKEAPKQRPATDDSFKRGGRKWRLIKSAIETDLGIVVQDLYYEPINGPCVEMQGYAGGWWLIDDEDCRHWLGYGFREAMETIRSHSMPQAASDDPVEMLGPFIPGPGQIDTLDDDDAGPGDEEEA